MPITKNLYKVLISESIVGKIDPILNAFSTIGNTIPSPVIANTNLDINIPNPSDDKGVKLYNLSIKEPKKTIYFYNFIISRISYFFNFA